MFTVRCPVHGTSVLLFADDILLIRNRPGGGIDVRYRCTCGHRGTLRTGGRRP